MLGETHQILDQGFWTDRKTLEIEELRNIRILVCGNTGVGKSTLINKVFGVSGSDEVTKSSDRKAGKHDIREEILYEHRPDLIIHDSGGFEAGDESQMQAVGNFVRERSSRTRLEERLHMIWFCIDMSSDRTQQTATGTFFKVVSAHASEVPIIVVATKRDRLKAIAYSEAREQYDEEITPLDQIDQECNKKATEKVKDRLDEIEAEMQEVEDGHFDACVSVAKSDLKSIKGLSDVIMQNVRSEKLRILYVAAQVADIDLKIDSAIIQAMKVYRHVLGTTSALGSVPMASSSNRTASAITVCNNVVQCFGLPTVNHKTIYELVKRTVWDDLGHNISVMIAEGIATVGLGSTILSGGMPFFLASGFVNLPLVVPATTRLLLMLAADLILILVKAFKETTFTCVGHPQLKDVQMAAIKYSDMASRVHQQVFELVPRRNIVKSYRHNDVKRGLWTLIHEFKGEVTKDVDLGSVHVRSHNSNSFSTETLLNNELSEMDSDIKSGKFEFEQRKRDLHHRNTSWTLAER